MKKNLMMALVISVVTLVSTNVQAQYIDLNTGRTVTLIKHVGNGMMYNTQNSRPVYLYINPTTNDTFYGRTGEKVNGRLFRNQQGRFVYDGDTYVYINGDYAVRTEANSYDKKVFKRDGDVVLKSEGRKAKKSLDGDVKLKDGEAKVKVETDGVEKDKNLSYKRKIDSEGNMLEKDSTYKTKINVDGSVKLKDKAADYKGKVDEDGDLKEKEKQEKRKLKRDEKAKIKTDREKTKAKDGKTKTKTDQ